MRRFTRHDIFISQSYQTDSGTASGLNKIPGFTVHVNLLKKKTVAFSLKINFVAFLLLFEIVEKYSDRVVTSICFCFFLGLESGFESRLGFDFADFSLWNFLKLVVRGFVRALRSSPLFHQLMASANILTLK